MKGKFKESFDELRKVCRAHSLRATPQRLEILRIVCGASNHPSVDEVYKQARKKLPAVSFDTVYRTLRSLEEHNLISRVQYLDDKTRYDPDITEHHHFICTECKSIIDFRWPALNSLNLPSCISNFGQIKQTYVEVRGLCSRCSKQK